MYSNEELREQAVERERLAQEQIAKEQAKATVAVDVESEVVDEPTDETVAFESKPKKSK